MLVHSDWLLTPYRAAVHVPTGTAVVADLHLGYDDARRRAGEAVPDAGLGEVLKTLSTLFAAHGVRRLIIAGDLAESAAGQSRVQEFMAWLAETGVKGAVIPGNHDRRLGLDYGLPFYPDGVELGGWRIVHGHARVPAGRFVLGHFHPCLRWGGVSAPCYLVGRTRLVLPAFSVDAAGVNVLHDRRWARCRLAVISANRVLDFGTPTTLLGRQRKGTRRDGPHAPPAPPSRPQVRYQYRSRHQS